MNFLVVGTVRNCEKKIFETIKCIENGLHFANKVEYFFVESDSDDMTLNSLEKRSKYKRNFSYESYGRLRSHKRLRTDRLAICRNRYLEYLKNEKNNWVQYLIVVDADGVCSFLNSKIVREIIFKNNWAVMTANRRTKYYDIFALRHKTWCPQDFNISIKEDLKNGLNYSQAYYKNVTSKMVYIKSSSDLIEVDSAFGGLAIYKKSSIPKNAKYNGLDENNEEICEHVSFHNSIRKNKGKIFINPKLIIGPSLIKFSIKITINALECFLKEILIKLRKLKNINLNCKS